MRNEEEENTKEIRNHMILRTKRETVSGKLLIGIVLGVGEEDLAGGVFGIFR